MLFNDVLDYFVTFPYPDLRVVHSAEILDYNVTHPKFSKRLQMIQVFFGDIFMGIDLSPLIVLYLGITLIENFG